MMVSDGYVGKSVTDRLVRRVQDQGLDRFMGPVDGLKSFYNGDLLKI